MPRGGAARPAGFLPGEAPDGWYTFSVRSFFLTFLSLSVFTAAACGFTEGAPSLGNKDGGSSGTDDPNNTSSSSGDPSSSSSSSGVSGSSTSSGAPSSSSSSGGSPSSSSSSGSSSSSSGTVSSSSSGGPGTLALTSAAFADGGKIPCAHVSTYCGGTQQSPPLAWTAGPAGTQSYAIVMRNDIPELHWILYNIPAGVTSLAANVERLTFTPDPPAGARQTRPPASFGNDEVGYHGPCPNPMAGGGNASRTYTFTVYALDVATLPDVANATPIEDILAKIGAHDLAESTLSGRQNAAVGACN